MWHPVRREVRTLWSDISILRPEELDVIYVFADYELDTQRYELRQQGVPCPLAPQGFNVLVYLVQHRDRVVSKEELFAQLWPHQIVSESTLTQRLRVVRRTLGDSGQHQHFIKTVHGRGYRFIAVVEEKPGDTTVSGVTGVAAVMAPVHSCPACQHENPSEAKFCNACGVLLSHLCSACGAANPPGAAFCNACATPLVSPTPLPTPTDAKGPDSFTSQDSVSPPIEPFALEAERRQLTVMFCDLVGSTPLSERLDPEDYRDVICAYQTACEAEAERFEGHIAQLLGDALLVYFGWPIAHEDDAQRAVRAGLAMLEAMESLNGHLEQDKGIRLAIRIAIHTGLVVVGDVGGRGRPARLALGATPHVAARLGNLATPNTVVISAATYQLVQGYFTVADLGLHALKGVAVPVQAYQVRQESGIQHRFEAATMHGLTPFVGRNAEVTLLDERWRHAREGLGQVVLLGGEAGIGKSRLVQMLKQRIAHESHTLMEYRCSPYYQHSAFYPIVEFFQRTLGFDRHVRPADKLMKLQAALAPFALTLDNTVPLLATLLSIPLSDADAPLDLTPQQQRQQTLTTILGIILALAEQQPVLMIVEDLHWVDPSTLELLDLLIDQTPTLRLFMVLTCRPVFRPPWGLRTHLTPLMLNRLARGQVAQLVARVAGGKRLPSAVVHHIVTQTDGVPLFIEELTKAILESGLVRETDDHYELTGPLSAVAIPTTLHDSLMARLDRLGTAKGIAQWGATLGRQFSYALLQAVSQREEMTLQQELGRLIEAELLSQRGVVPQATYLFKHALIQEAAYQSLLRSTRHYYNQRAARVLTEQFPEIAATHPELIAHHYTEAACHEQAVPYWQRAGQRAIERSAHVEAAAHLSQGLDVLLALPETQERDRHELVLRLALGTSLSVTKGWPAPEVGKVYSRAQSLCQQVGETAQWFPVLWGLWHFHFVRGEPQRARELGEQLLTLAQQHQEPTYFMAAHIMLGGALTALGALEPALTHWEQTFALYDPQQHHALTYLFGADPGVFSLAFASHALWLRGYPDQALMRSRQALELAQSLSHPFSRALAHCYAAMLHQLRREPRLVQQQAEAAMSLCTEQGFTYYLAWATLLRGWALTAQSAERANEDAMVQLRQGFADLLATGAGIRETYYRALLVEAAGSQGKNEAGQQLLAEAFAAMQRTAERYWEAELYRWRGELLGQGAERPQWESAEAHFLRALAVARSQQSKSLELRAALSLGRLWQEQGRRGDACALLTLVYNWFTEGFDTADLQEAKALLDA
jgi:predicted ATPase/class 3 adenylate cyclase/DNA-binding winged helix-turn-helix (wHTH) protein